MKPKTIILIVLLIATAYVGYLYWEKNVANKGAAAQKNYINKDNMQDALDENVLFPNAKFTGDNELSKILNS